MFNVLNLIPQGSLHDLNTMYTLFLDRHEREREREGGGEGEGERENV